MKFFILQITTLIFTLFLISDSVNSFTQTQFSGDTSSAADTTSSGDSTSITDTVSAAFKPNVNPEVTAVRIENGKIKLDGELKEYEWKKAGFAGNFTEISPGDNIRPEVETKAYVMYDDDNIYFAFECFDDMENIRTSMSDRDNMYSDDWVGPFIDTYGTLKEAYEFYVNPYGVQGDLFWTPNNESSSPDFIFESETKIYKDRWVAEMKIPFKTLKFPDINVQQWRVHFLRNRPRNLRQRIYWSSVSRDNPNFLGQSGTILGIEGVKSGNNLEFLPYVSGSEAATLNDPINSESQLDYKKPEADFGFDVKYGITSNLNLNGTYNPDFSQVEADAPQIDVNNPFALFYEEKRPFFLDGESSFRTNLNYVYTRSINNPIFATKLTGKIGKNLEVGYMNAYDENTPFVIPLEDRSFVLQSNKSSFINIFRLKYDLGGQNYIGGLYTDREYSSDSGFTSDFKGYNRNLGMDFSFNFLKNFYFKGQVTGFAEREISDTSFFDNPTKFGNEKQYNVAFNGEAFTGLSTYFAFNRESEKLGFFTEYNYNSPTARRGVGFLNRNDFHTGYSYIFYNIYLENKLFRRITPDADLELTYNTDGVNKTQYLQTGVTFEFQNGTRAFANYKWINNQNYRNTQLDYINGWNFTIENFANNIIGGGIYYSRSKEVVTFGATPSVGGGNTIRLFSTIRPIDRIYSDFNYEYSQLAETFGGELFYAGWIFSNTTSYQFNRNLFLRLVTQYDSFNKAFTCDPLISYKWNPFTALFLGTNHAFEQIQTSALSNQTELKESSRQIFLKFQYLWQM
ncbi:MAG TPA: DUF5916 domain-containing protein [Ignavibacteria bacterium]|nr:DUF5916 domain-containing protein [Ignavibacteria bacterium]